MSKSPDTSDWVELTGNALAVAEAVAFAASAAAGGIAVFLGTTRAETNSTGQALVALEYQAYDAMAASQLVDLAARARQRWPIEKLVLLHRTGRVAVGEPSVAIAASTPHRADAFAACQWLIDTLKNELAVWKREIWADGSASWVEPAAAETPNPKHETQPTAEAAETPNPKHEIRNKSK